MKMDCRTRAAGRPRRVEPECDVITGCVRRLQLSIGLLQTLAERYGATAKRVRELTFVATDNEHLLQRTNRPNRQCKLWKQSRENRECDRTRILEDITENSRFKKGVDVDVNCADL